MTGILVKVINVFRGENLALFTVTSIHCIPKKYKNRNYWKVLGNISDCVKKVFYSFGDFNLNIHVNNIIGVYLFCCNISQPEHGNII